MYGGYHTIIYHQFVPVRVREEPHWQSAYDQYEINNWEVGLSGITR